MALSLGFPPPAVNWHCVFVEPGLSSLNFIKAISRLSGRLKILIISLISRKINYLANLLIFFAMASSLKGLTGVSSDIILEIMCLTAAADVPTPFELL